MKTSLIIGAALTILGVAAAPTFAQNQTTQTTATNTNAAGGASYVQTSKIVGTKVRTAQGEEVGVIKDVVLDRSSGCMAYTVLSTGGTGTRVAQEKLVAVPWTVYSATSDPSILTVSIDRERIYNAPAVEYARINEYSSAGWINNVYSYYGVSGQVGVSGERERQFNTGATTTNAQVGAGAANESTNRASANNPPPPAEGPSATPGVSASPSASASVTPSTSASHKGKHGETGEESTSTGGKTKATATPSSRHRTESTEEGTETKTNRAKTSEEGAETSGSPSRERSKTSHHRTTKEETGTGKSTGAEAQPTPQE